MNTIIDSLPYSRAGYRLLSHCCWCTYC